MDKIKKLLVANRGEIAIRIFRACSELGIRSVAIYSEEDKTSLFRTKADESYLIKDAASPLSSYLDIEKIIAIAKSKHCDAIHPGYGFLSENAEFARRCRENGIIFVGPDESVLHSLGDKVQSKLVAKKAGVQTIEGVETPIRNKNEALEIANQIGYPVMVKACAGGGGRGMRIVEKESDLMSSFVSAQNESKKAFGSDDMFIEKYIRNPKHIEVQIIADNHGNILHLYERDCSIQRRHQKVVEFAPAFSISENTKNELHNDAIKICKEVGYTNAGTVEFLVDEDENHYFIEVNPRVQVEHTVSELITGIDIVQTQILIADGKSFDSDEIGIYSQDDIHTNGYAIQCRITTEDPANNFMPDTGKIDLYRTSSGFGVRLDGGNGFTGSVITPYYDSLLVKITAFSRTFNDTINKAIRALRETKISGVKTNIGFIINVLNTEEFHKGTCDTGFISKNPELFDIKPSTDKELKVLNFISERSIRGGKKEYNIPQIPEFTKTNSTGTKDIFEQKGAKGLSDWILNQDKLLITDTTLRDAHQSLMATRMRTRDMLPIAEATNELMKDLFSLEMWGGATFDVSYRFLKEDPWIRLQELRKRIPNILFQMLLRGNNTVGYKNYPDNVVVKFVQKAAENGIDVFRVFDSLNYIDGMRLACDSVLEQGKILEATLCYTGDILDESRDKYSLEYYVKKAKELESIGANIIAIKDMSALLKPYAATKLISALKNEISVPIHLHTHDTTGNGVATIINACESGVDIVDTCFNSMSSLTSQPALNSVVAALENTPRQTGISLSNCDKISNYYKDVRSYYSQFESDLKSGTTEIYRYEIPGGQYSNLKPQVESFGLGEKFDEVKLMYKKVNDMLGDIIKVTPSSKMVGDMAIFMVANGLTPENIYEKGKNLDYPDSVISFFKGMMGQPEGGFNEKLQKIVLKDEKPITKRAGLYIDPFDFEKDKKDLSDKYKMEFDEKDIISHALYPKVFEDYLDYRKTKGNFTYMDTPTFFEGINEKETVEVPIEEGKILIIKLIEKGRLEKDGYRNFTYEVNGNRREVRVFDESAKITEREEDNLSVADPNNDKEIGASIPGRVVKVLVKENDKVSVNDPLVVVEAMKMETNILSKSEGIVKSILIKENDTIDTDQLLIVLE